MCLRFTEFIIKWKHQCDITTRSKENPKNIWLYASIRKPEMNVLAAATAAKSLQSCPTLCDPRYGLLPGSSVPGILQVRTLEWVAISFPSAWKWKMKVKSLSQSCPTPSNPMDCSLPGSSVHGIFQARVLEWGAIAFSDECACWVQSCSVSTPACHQIQSAFSLIKNLRSRNHSHQFSTT